MIHRALTLAAPPSAEALRAATRQQTVERSAIILLLNNSITLMTNACSLHHCLLLSRSSLNCSTTPRWTTWLSAPARQGQRGNPGLDEEALAGGPQTRVPASPLEAEVWVEEALLALCQPLTRATFVNRTPAARTPNVTWELIDEGTQGLSVLAREGTLVTPCVFA